MQHDDMAWSTQLLVGLQHTRLEQQVGLKVPACHMNSLAALGCCHCVVDASICYL